MIIEKLKDYYERMASNPESGIAPYGWAWRGIPFIIVITKTGEFMDIEDTRIDDGKKKKARMFLAPQPFKKSSNIVSNLLWESPEYVLGVGSKNLDKKKDAFRQMVKQFSDTNSTIIALLKFLDSPTRENMKKHPLYEELIEEGSIISFRIDGSKKLIFEATEVKKTIENYFEETDVQAEEIIDMITGEQDRLALKHPLIKGLPGGQSFGVNLVSFNPPSFRSWGNVMGHNAPMGKHTAFAYVTALNTLLANGSGQKISIGDTTILFWSEKETKLEKVLASLFVDSVNGESNITVVDSIRSVLSYIQAGGKEEKDETFYVLGLLANTARVAVKFWQEGTVEELCANIRQYLNDVSITKSPRDPEHFSLRYLFLDLTETGKSDAVNPKIAGDTLEAIFGGTLFPTTLLNMIINRIKSDVKYRVNSKRASLLKAFLNRYFKIYPNPKFEEIGMELNNESKIISYQLGRLFATFEKIQEEGMSSNNSLREQFYNSASAAPGTTFPILIKKSIYHLTKIKSGGRKIFFEKILQEIMVIIQEMGGFPKHHNLYEQGYFALGYFQQRQRFFTKTAKEDDSGGEETVATE